jgi:hypothetical protein
VNRNKEKLRQEVSRKLSQRGGQDFVCRRCRRNGTRTNYTGDSSSRRTHRCPLCRETIRGMETGARQIDTIDSTVWTLWTTDHPHPERHDHRRRYRHLLRAAAIGIVPTVSILREVGVVEDDGNGTDLPVEDHIGTDKVTDYHAAEEAGGDKKKVLKIYQISYLKLEFQYIHSIPCLSMERVLFRCTSWKSVSLSNQPSGTISFPSFVVHAHRSGCSCGISTDLPGTQQNPIGSVL